MALIIWSSKSLLSVGQVTLFCTDKKKCEAMLPAKGSLKGTWSIAGLSPKNHEAYTCKRTRRSILWLLGIILTFMFSKVKNFLNLKRRAKPARQLQVNEQNDQRLPDVLLLPEIKRLSFNSQTLAEPQLRPVLDHPTVRQDDRTLPDPNLLPEVKRLSSEFEQIDQTLTKPQLLTELDYPICEQNNPTLTDSRFPPELEHLIFEYAAREYRSTIPSLMRVASRVKQW